MAKVLEKRQTNKQTNKQTKTETRLKNEIITGIMICTVGKTRKQKKVVKTLEINKEKN